MHNSDNILAKQAPGGYTLYYMGEVEMLKKIQAQENNENFKAIMQKLNIDPNNIKRPPGVPVQSSFNRYLRTYQSVDLIIL